MAMIGGIYDNKSQKQTIKKIYENKRKEAVMMFNIERYEEILNILDKYKSISVNKLSKLLYVSAPTIR